MPQDDLPPALRLETVTEKTIERVIVRYPVALAEMATEAAEALDSIIPVVEAYLGVEMPGSIRLDLLPQARVSGVNPAIGLIRHSIMGVGERSPRLAGMLSYQVGHILWYRATNEGSYRRPAPRVQPWLLEAALLPLRYVWLEREDWLDAVAAYVKLLKDKRPLPLEKLELYSELPPIEQTLAVAQCMLRGQSLTQRHPDWPRELCRYLSMYLGLSGFEALERLTGVTPELWEERFGDDLEAWLRVSTSADSGIVD